MTDERKKEIIDMYKKYGFAIKFEGNYKKRRKAHSFRGGMESLRRL